MTGLVKPLTAMQVLNAKPREKPYKLFDGGRLFLQVSPAGGKHWKFKYRRADGKEAMSRPASRVKFFLSWWKGCLPCLRHLWRDYPCALMKSALCIPISLSASCVPLANSRVFT